MTKQTPFPTTWRESLNGQNHSVIINSNYLLWSVWDHYFCSPWRLTARHIIALVQYAFCTGMTGFSWSESLMYLSWQSVLTWDSLARQLRSENIFTFQPYTVKYFTKCLQWMENVDYLLIAKPVAINHLGIHCDCCRHFFCVDRLLVVLFEGHDSCCFMWQEELCLKFVRSGNKVV